MTGVLPLGTGAVVERRLTPEPERELPRDPVAWVIDELGEHPWSVQRRIMRTVAERRYVAVPSCHGSGKSWTGSRLVAWWIAAHPLGEAFAVTTAPTGPQIKAILWREIGRAHRRGGLPGRVTLANEWMVGPRGGEELVAFGRKPKDYADPAEARAAFTGIHAAAVLVVLDEATGIPTWLWEAVDSLVTNEAARVLAIGNPDDPASDFARACQPGSGWEVLPVSALDTPAFTRERVPEQVAAGLVSKTWVEERRRDWGEDSPLYQSKVLGVFPDVSDERVVSPSMVKAAHLLDLPGREPGAYGMDVARFGQDESCIYRSRGGVVRHVSSWRKAATTETEGHAHRALDRHAKVGVPMVVDSVGVGAGPYDHLREDGYEVYPFEAGERARDPARFKNRRAEAWWSFREEMAEGLVDLDPEDDDLAAQLQAPKWRQDSRGRVVVESKDDMRRRGVASPDRADAAIMAREGDRAAGPRSGYRVAGNGGRRAQKSLTADLMRRPM